MNPYHSNCPICRKLGITVDTTHYIQLVPVREGEGECLTEF
jgi:hypothetical protein